MFAWMVYAVWAATLVAVAARALEGLLRLYGQPTRWVWACALVLGPALPVAGWLVPAGMASAVFPAGEMLLAPLTLAPLVVEAVAPTRSWQGLLPWVWGGMSAALLATVLVTSASLSRRSGEWRRAVVDGSPVLVSRRTGPAVVGLLRGRIVVPEWTLELNEGLRALLLVHEREHLRARDHHLVLAALLVLVLLPWNPALWWQWRRLRLAVEVDCDGRVLRSHPDRRRYGALLLEVGRHVSRPGVGFAAFAEPRSLIERRLEMMTAPQPTRRTVKAGAAVLVAAAALALACESPAPPEVVSDAAPEPAARVVAGEDGPMWTPYDAPPRLTNRTEVARALREVYPAELREAGTVGTVVLWFLIDEAGRVERTELHTSSGNELLDEAALRVALLYEFTPAEHQGKPKAVWVAQPIIFQPSGEAEPSGSRQGVPVGGG